MSNDEPRVVIEEERDPVQVAEALARDERFERNWAWLEMHGAEVYANRGKFICIAGQELFVADSVEQAYAEARSAHPDDDGAFTRYVPLQRLARIYLCESTAFGACVTTE
jgi:hypothetical protein